MCSFLICKMGKTLKSTPNDPSPPSYGYACPDVLQNRRS